MYFNSRYQTLPSRLYHHQPPLPLKGAKAGHFNAALAEQLQWSEEDKAQWVEICSGQKPLLSLNLWPWFMLAISLVNGRVNWVMDVVY
jgi:Uncharacterized conserved protein